MIFHPMVWRSLPLLLCLLSSAAQAEHPPIPLRGPPFSDPAQLAPVPAGWGQRPIAYADWARGAAFAITLDQHLYPALLPYVQHFAREHQVDIAVQEGTCGTSAGALTRKQADMGGFCCPPSLEDRLPGLTYHTVGIAALALLVNSSNPVDNLPLETVRLAYRGKRYRWSEFHSREGAIGPDLPLFPLSRLHCKSRPGHWRLLLDNEDLFGPNVAEMSSIPDMMQQVASDPSALGYEVAWNIPREQVTGKVRTIAIDGYSPFDEQALLRGDYPLYRTYNITTWEGAQAKPLATQLVAYLMEQVERHGHEFGIVSTQRLKAAGWRFRGNELYDEPH